MVHIIKGGKKRDFGILSVAEIPKPSLVVVHVVLIKILFFYDYVTQMIVSKGFQRSPIAFN